MTFLAILLALCAMSLALLKKKSGVGGPGLNLAIVALLAGTFTCAFLATRPEDVTKNFVGIPSSCGTALGRLILDQGASGDVTIVRFTGVLPDDLRLKGIKEALSGSNCKITYIHEVEPTPDKVIFSLTDLEAARAGNPGINILISLNGLPYDLPETTSWPQTFAYSPMSNDGHLEWLKSKKAAAVIRPRTDGNAPPLDGKSPEEIFNDYFTVLK